MAQLNIVILAHDEPEAVRLIKQVIKINPKENPARLFLVHDEGNLEKDFTLNYWRELNEAGQPEVNFFTHSLNGDFGEHRNFIHKYIPEGEWIIYLDADEMVDDNFIVSLQKQIDSNPTVDKYNLARVNTYYNADTEDDTIPEVDWSNPQGLVYPDWQGRVYRLKPGFQWTGKLHETLLGPVNVMTLEGKDFSILHHKSRQRQEKQDAFYKSLGQTDFRTNY